MPSPYTLKAKRYKTDSRPFLEVVMGDNEHLVLRVRQATDTGYIECDPNGVADLAYPNSELRRARVKERGSIGSTITACEPSQYVFLETTMADQKESKNRYDLYDCFYWNIGTNRKTLGELH